MTPTADQIAAQEAGVIEAIIFVTGAERSSVTPDGDLNDLALDSLDCMELAARLEEQHGIEIVDAQVEAWQTVRDVCATVATLVGGRAHG